jgi:hypothetical protein
MCEQFFLENHTITMCQEVGEHLKHPGPLRVEGFWMAVHAVTPAAS